MANQGGVRTRYRLPLDPDVVPDFNRFFLGKAPDLGAIEQGAPPVLYGPREGE